MSYAMSRHSTNATSDALFVRWRENQDSLARDELVRRFLPLARKLARRYAGSPEPFEDLVQVASLGLLKAIDRYDPSLGNAFSSFAVPTILGELKRHFRDTGWSAHVPRAAQELALKVHRASDDLTTELGRPPGVQEIAEYLELSLEYVIAGLDAHAAHHSRSLDAPLGDEESEAETLGDAIGEEDDRFRLVDARLSLSAAIAKLPHHQREVLALRFVGDLKQTQIAQRLGCSQMQVSRLLQRATARLKGLAELES